MHERVCEGCRMSARTYTISAVGADVAVRLATLGAVVAHAISCIRASVVAHCAAGSEVRLRSALILAVQERVHLAVGLRVRTAASRWAVPALRVAAKEDFGRGALSLIVAAVKVRIAGGAGRVNRRDGQRARARVKVQAERPRWRAELPASGWWRRSAGQHVGGAKPVQVVRGQAGGQT